MIVRLTACLAALIAPIHSAAAETIDPFHDHAVVRVLLFVRSDCPLTKRYGPELERLAEKYKLQGVKFWLVYSAKDASGESMREFKAEYHLPGTPVSDVAGQIAKRAHCMVSPEAAVFNANSHLEYHGRIDDRWSDFGKGRPEAQSHDLDNAIESVLQHKPVVPSETKAVGCALADVN